MKRSDILYGTFAILTVTLALAFGSVANAAKVLKVKNNKVLIGIEDGDTDITVGGRFIVMVGDKKRALIEIEQVKNGRAVGKVVKGQAEADGKLVSIAQVLGGAKSPDKSVEEPKSDLESGLQQSETTTKSTANKKTAGKKKKSTKHSAGLLSPGISFGAVIGYSLDTQNVTASNSAATATESLSMSGSGLSLKAFGDMPFSGPLSLMARLGFEQFSVTGSSSKSSVKTDILYGTADMLLRYNFGDGAFVPFVLGGLGLHLPLSKSSNVLNENLISMTTVFFLGGGLNYQLNDTSYVHTSLEYGFFPPSNDVKTNLIAIRAGMGFRF
jgi:hypothetical protein